MTALCELLAHLLLLRRHLHSAACFRALPWCDPWLSAWLRPGSQLSAVPEACFTAMPLHNQHDCVRVTRLACCLHHAAMITKACIYGPQLRSTHAVIIHDPSVHKAHLIQQGMNAVHGCALVSNESSSCTSYTTCHHACCQGVPACHHQQKLYVRAADTHQKGMQVAQRLLDGGTANDRLRLCR